jgi:hypothetical protein
VAISMLERARRRRAGKPPPVAVGEPTGTADSLSPSTSLASSRAPIWSTNGYQQYRVANHLKVRGLSPLHGVRGQLRPDFVECARDLLTDTSRSRTKKISSVPSFSADRSRSAPAEQLSGDALRRSRSAPANSPAPPTCSRSHHERAPVPADHRSEMPLSDSERWGER